MAGETEAVRNSETIHITVLRCRHLRGVKGDSLTSYVHVEFDSKSLGDSQKVDSTAESEAEYNYSTTLDCSFTDAGHTLDSVSYKPLLISVNEVLPKEKKQKDEKTSTLGQCTVDLLPIVLGEVKVEQQLTLHAVVGSPLENSPLEKPEIDITISVNEPLMDETLLKESNLLTVRLGSSYSLPDSWSLTGPQYNYTIGLPIPATAEKEIPLIFSNGVLKPGAEKEMHNRPLKWYNLPNVVSGAQYIPGSVLELLPLEEEKGDFKDKEHADFRRDSENEKNRITWDCERRTYLDPATKSAFQTKVSQTRLWPVEIMRCSLPSQAKAAAAAGKKEKGSTGTEDDHQISYHGICYVDLAPLLYPGVRKVAGAFAVQPFSDHDLADKTKRKHAIASDVVRVNSSTSRMTGSSPLQKGGKAGASTVSGKDVPAKKGSALLRTVDSGSEVESTGAAHHTTNIEGEMYLEARSYVYLEFELHQPLVPRREPEKLAKLVSEYIPSRSPMRRAVGGSQKAVDDYHNQIASVSSMVLEEFRELFGEELVDPAAPQNFEKQEERRKQLLFKLNSSGKYFAFKEQMKHSIVKLVREKYMKTTAFTDKDQLQEFLSELYVYLVDEMHKSLEKVLLVDTLDEPSPEPCADSEHLKRFAEEEEMNENYEAAGLYYQERLIKDKNDPSHWFDYGTCNMLTGDYSKSAECFKEAVSINQNYMEGLILYGILRAMDDKYEEAEAMLERATMLPVPSSVPIALPWTILALFYGNIGNDIRAEHSFAEARKINAVSPAVFEHEPGTEPSQDKIENMQSKGDLDTVTSSLLPPSAGAIKNPSGSIRSASTSKASKVTGSKGGPGAVRNSTANSASSVDHAHAHDNVSSLEQKKDEETSNKTIFLQTAEWLLDMKAIKYAEIALSFELLEPAGGPTADYYIALGRLHMMRKEYNEAEEVLKKASVLNYQHPDVWALTGHLQYKLENYVLARDCYERTLSFIADASGMHSIYLRLGSIYLVENEFLKAKQIFLLACKKSPSCITWLGVGTACYRLDELSEAEDALAEANILNNSNAEVWAYLSLVCLQTNRELEAEQSYKYTMKLNLKNEKLLEEIRQAQRAAGFGDPSF